MLESVKGALSKDVTVDSVKDVLLTEVNVRAFLEQEIEIQKLKEMLATEIKLKEFLIQEVDVKKMFSSKKTDASTEFSENVIPNLVIEKSDNSEQPRRTVQQQKNSTNLSSNLSQTEKKKTQAHRHQQQAQQHVLEQSVERPLREFLPDYIPDLVETMRAEHKEFLITYNELMHQVESEDYAKASESLAIFGSKLRNHYYQADRNLYLYLKKYIQFKYPKREKAFRELNLELKNISIEVFFTNSQSPNIPVNKNNRDKFLEEYERLGDMLNIRIHKEETILFVMYEESVEVLDDKTTRL